MCADILRLRDQLDIFKKEGIDYLHIDVMDGNFVPNLQLGTDFVKQLRRVSNIPLDIHLMISHPDYKIAWFDPQPGEYVSVHFESTPHIHRALAVIRDAGAKPMVALNPGTPINVIEDLLADMDAVMLMTVNPGFAGQKMIAQMPDKIDRLRTFLDERGGNDIEIEVDGNVSFPNAKSMSEAGANMFVAGTASIFTASRPMEESIRLLRGAIGSHTSAP